MADYRVERARIRLSDSMHGLDPNAHIDATELCWIDPSGIDASSCGVTPLADFYAADYPGWQEDDKWFPAQDGLRTVGALLSHYKRILQDGSDPLGREMPVIEKKVTVLQEVEKVLSAAAEADAYFCLAVSD